MSIDKLLRISDPAYEFRLCVWTVQCLSDKWSNTPTGAKTNPKNFDLNENLTPFGTWIISDSGRSI